MKTFFLADDAAAGGLAPFRVVDADHRRLGDARAVGEHVLELGGVDVLAARDDHVLGAADDPVETVLVQARLVAGPEPAFRSKTGVVLPVAAHQRRSAHPDLAVDELHLAMRSRFSRAAGLAKRV